MTHGEDRRLAPAPAIDLAALGKDHATDLGASHPSQVVSVPEASDHTFRVSLEQDRAVSYTQRSANARPIPGLRRHLGSPGACATGADVHRALRRARLMTFGQFVYCLTLAGIDLSALRS